MSMTLSFQSNSLNEHSIYPEDDDPFEIFDPRGLFSPQAMIPPTNQHQHQHQHQQEHLSIPTRTSSPPTSSLFHPRPWSLDHPHPSFNEQQPNKTTIHNHSFSPPRDRDTPPTNQKQLNLSPPRDMSPVESPISPCSSLPYCRSPPTSLSMSHSLSLPRGRSPPARFALDPLPDQSDSPSSSSSPSPPHHSNSAYPSASTQTRQNASSSHHPRPAPIVTCGIRDLSLPSRLSHLRSTEPPCSVSSLAYSDMDASPAVNFLSAFADATLPTVRTEMSPVATVPSDVLHEGDQVAGYALGPIIGRGGFSVVRQARHALTDQCVAVKIVKRSSSAASGSETSLSRSSTIHPVSLHASISSRERSSSVALSTNRHLVNSTHLPLPTSATEALASALLKQEIRIWSNLRHHPNIVPLISLHETFSQTLLFMPMCEGGNLLQLLNHVKLNPTEQETIYQDFIWTSPDSIPSSSLTQPDLSHTSGGLRLDLVRLIFWQIVQGLKYLHTEAGIVHKDIKLENILIQKGQIKISDFGLATYPFPERSADVTRSVKGKASSSWNRDLSLPKHFSALPRIAEGLVTGGGANPRLAFRDQAHHNRPRLPPTLDNSLFLTQPVKEDEDDDFHPFQQSALNMFPTAAGSLAYTPPEQIRSEIPLACPSLDIWALGCVLYGLLEGNLPFQDDFEPRLRLKIMNGQFEFPPALVVHPDKMCEAEADNRMMIAKVLKGCLAVDRNARWMIDEIATSAWLAPQRCKLTSTLSDDGLSSDGIGEPSSASKRSNSPTSSLPSAWSIDEMSMNIANRLSIPIAPPDESGISGSSHEGFPVPPPFTDVTCTSPPLIRKDLFDLRKLLTTTPSHPSSSRSSASVNRPFNCRSHTSADLPPSPGLERVARPKHRGGSSRHQNHFRVSLSRVSVVSPQPSQSRSHSRNRSPFRPSK